MMMVGHWWTAHVAWRFKPTPAPPPRAARIPTPAKAAPTGGCVRCSKPREDQAFKHCRRCRTLASVNQTRRRKMLARKGVCSRCSGPRDDDKLVCSGCRARERERYRQRKADRLKMRP